MTTRRVATIGAVTLLLALVGWVSARVLARLGERAQTEGPSSVAASAPPVVPRITATLFYGTADDHTLVPVTREIALAEGLVLQGRQILTAQLERAPSPYVSVIPAGTTLRAFYITGRGEAFVDLSADVSSRHPGGSSAELLTVYAVVNAVTSNLPTITRVQILIDGQEADTLAGHIDLRYPLARDTSIVSKP